MSDKILLVDDDPNILNGYRRTLRKQYKLRTALGPELGLEVFRTEGPFAVVISDMNMPVMDGIQFLNKVRKINSDTVRIMLTGHADLTTAMEAINEGNIFRFLTKPTSPENMATAIEAGLRQYQIVTAEKVLLEKTLKENIRTLTDILSMVNPAAFGRASRIRRYVNQIVKMINLQDTWEYETAAMLSQIGFIALPPNLLDKIYAMDELDENEKKMFFEYPKIGAGLIHEIPRMELVAQIIERQLWDFQKFPLQAALTEEQKLVHLGAQILRCVLSFDEKISRGLAQDTVVAILERKIQSYNPKIVALLKKLKIDANYKVTKKLQVKELEKGMITLQEIRSSDGLLLVAKYQEITLPIMERLTRFHQDIGVKEPIEVALVDEEDEHSAF